MTALVGPLGWLRQTERMSTMAALLHNLIRCRRSYATHVDRRSYQPGGLFLSLPACHPRRIGKPGGTLYTTATPAELRRRGNVRISSHSRKEGSRDGCQSSVEMTTSCPMTSLSARRGPGASVQVGSTENPGAVPPSAVIPQPGRHPRLNPTGCDGLRYTSSL